MSHFFFGVVHGGLDVRDYYLNSYEVGIESLVLHLTLQSYQNEVRN
jgi:hypothetical protein